MQGKFRVFIIAISIFSVGQLMAQPLSGIYTVGSGGSYSSLTAAVADLTTKGVSSPVVFKLKTGT
ncbi:MAG TPA: hypothetical protein DIS90_09385, partial [Cytophagales bacterium]|nr:hypothetical protein [Cytophagales bacterium]